MVREEVLVLEVLGEAAMVGIMAVVVVELPILVGVAEGVGTVREAVAVAPASSLFVISRDHLLNMALSILAPPTHLLKTWRSIM
ncbi:hypothetical protein HY949_04080 [Candidatus Gottesmanbacteria bacterium]|nr:hypothetical protein [Candidatus Gottesmanbacteria bacterium]